MTTASTGSKKATTRRELLMGFAGVLSVGPVARRPMGDAPKSDVVVIGAGLAGLNAAILLNEEGMNVTVLEGASRVGGRVFTADHIDGWPELGASQIGPYYARVRDMATRLGVELAAGANISAPYAYSVGGMLIGKSAWRNHPLNRTVGAERTRPPSSLLGSAMAEHNPLKGLDDWLETGAAAMDVPLGQWLKDQGVSTGALRLINEGPVDPDIWSVSALMMLHDDARNRLWVSGQSADLDRFQKRGPTSHRVVGGSSRLPEAMARHLGEAVQLEKVVTRISVAAGGGVEVSCQDRTTYRADFAVCALPFTVLRRIAIDPPPPPLQQQAIGLLPYRSNTQVHFRLKGDRYWEEDGLDASIWSDGPVTLVRQKIAPDGSRDRLQALSLGKKADRLDQMPPRARAEFVLSQIERMRPSMRGKLEVTAIYSWSQAPFAGGFRHSFFPGQISRFAQQMIRPHGPIHFAGEHTRRIEIGMESAMESGERAALEILERVA